MAGFDLTPQTSVKFLALGDFGEITTGVVRNALAMSNYAEEVGLNFIVGLGDNFYPGGVTFVDDPQFQEWIRTFLGHPSLRVPWYQCLGNHDYEGIIKAQIDFTHSDLNPDGLWRLPAKTYDFQIPFADEDGAIHMLHVFALDTNGVQGGIRRIFPHIVDELKASILELSSKLEASTARWKIVFGHHAMYTKSVDHGMLGRCLKDHEYVDSSGEHRPGFGLEDVLSRNGVDAYLSGHEHKLEYHLAHGVHHFVSGASGVDNRFYKSEDMTMTLDWVGGKSHNGFLAAEVSFHAAIFKFISLSGEILKEVIISK